MSHTNTLEFNTILTQLSDLALSAGAKARCLALMPAATITDATRLMDHTTQAKNILDTYGSPPIAHMAQLENSIQLAEADGMLTIDNILDFSHFLAACTRLTSYLKRAQQTGSDIAFYANAMLDLTDLEEEINRHIQNNQIHDQATPALYQLRKGIRRKEEEIKTKMESLLKSNRKYCVDGFVAVRNGRFTLPVEKKFKNKIPGILVDMSNTGGTCFIEPTAASKLTDQLSQLQIEEDNEVRIILYTLTALIYDHLPSIKINMEAMEALDFVFAKGKLSQIMGAAAIRMTSAREIRLLNATHPLLKDPVPLNFALGGDTQGIIITGPNTGGKTVAIKTVGLFSLMVQSGLHVPADPASSMCVFDQVFCDIGDGQSISQNLSTFSSHMRNIIDVLSKITPTSLVLFDELGSGTDPAEGMGIATAILETLLTANCLFTVTTHYPEIKDFAHRTPGVINARMAFDRETLKPLYRLEIGEAGESSALYIAQRLGLPAAILSRAREIVYSQNPTTPVVHPAGKIHTVTALAPDAPMKKPTDPSQRFVRGDNVKISPDDVLGIVYQPANAMGEVSVQIKGEKHMINHKRLTLHVSAKDMYPEDYDFSIIFDTVENRKARHLMGRKHVAGNKVVHNTTSEEK